MKRVIVAALLLLAGQAAQAADPSFGLIQVQVSPAIVHAKVSGVADGADTDVVRPSDWNAAHTAPTFNVLTVGGGGAVLEWTAQPAALTELFGDTTHRLLVDLTTTSTARIVVNVTAGGATPAKLRVQYTTDLTGAGGWAYLDASAGPSVSINATGPASSSWVTLTGAAKAPVLLRIVGIDG